MTASKTAKAAGLDNLKELAALSKQSTQTLTNWYNDKPELFDLVVKGAVIQKKCETLVQFASPTAPRIPVTVSAYCVTVDGIKYSHDDFRAGLTVLTAADSQRVSEAIRQFYIFAGDL